MNDKIKCDLCGSSRFMLLYKKPEREFDAEILKCLYCGLIFIYPQSSKDELRLYYQDEAVVKDSDLKRFKKRLNRLNSFLGKIILKEFYGYKRIIHCKVSIFEKLCAFFLRYFLIKNIVPFSGEGKILDIGCGSGLYLALLKNIGWDVCGVEVNKYACEQAKKLGIKVVCGELEQTNFPSGYFDVIRLVHVLEHLSFPSHTFTEIRRILKPGGTIYLETPNQKSFAFRCFKEKWLEDRGHLYAFSPYTLDLFCKKFGLYIKRIKFKSSKGKILDSLEYLWKKRFSRAFPISISRNKVFRALIIKPLCLFLNRMHWADTLIAEIIKNNPYSIDRCYL